MSAHIDVHMRETDAFSWTMEKDPVLRMTVVAVAVVDGVPDWDEVVRRMERLTRAVPMFRQRVIPTPGGLAPPKWVVDSEFDIGWHVRRVAAPAPGDLDAVLDLAARLGTAAFDPVRPLWEVWLVDGLEGGRSAWIAKVHHMLTDGIGGVQLLAHVFDVDGIPLANEAPPVAPPPGDLSTRASLRSALAHNAEQARAVARGAFDAAVRTAQSAREDPRAAVAGAMATWRSLLDALAPSGDRLSPVMTERGLRRRYGALDVPLDGLRAAGHAINGGTVNDAFVTAVTAGLRRYHAMHSATVPELRMTMPISIRKPGDATAGNRIALIRIELPILPADPVMRMAETHRRTERWKAAPGLAYMEPAYAVVNYLPAAYLQGLARNVDFVASNVPGFSTRVSLAGAPLVALYPYAPTGGTGVNFTMMSCAGSVHVGVNADAKAIPDMDAFMTCVRAGFDEVLAIGSTGHQRHARRQVARRRPVAATTG